MRRLIPVVFAVSVATLAGCSSPARRPVVPQGGVHLITPKSLSPGLIRPAPMAKTAVLPASAMRTPVSSRRQVRSDIQGLSYSQIPGSASYAAAAPDGSLWVLSDQPSGPDKYIWHYANGAWSNISGLATRIAVAPNGTLYAINSGGGAYAFSNGAWSAFGGGCRDLAAAADGSLYVISNGGGADGAIWHYASGNWTQQPGSGNRLAASWDSQTYSNPGGTITPQGFYVINSLGSIYYLGSNGYIQIPGAASAVAPMRGGLFALGYPNDPNGNVLYYYNLANATWGTKGGSGASISTDGFTLYIVSASGAIYYSTIVPKSAAGTLNVADSSYVNDKAQNLGPQTLPREDIARAYADFFQDGSEALFIATQEYNVNDPSTYSNKGHLYFYRQVNGAWMDQTSRLLADNTGCYHPRKAVVADFNGDGKPDVFLACHGIDTAPFAGEKPLLLSSQPDGTYKTTVLPFTGFFHGAAAAVLNKPGYADIVVVDNTVQHTPYFLINNGDGTFHADFSRLPASVQNKQIFSAELIDFDNSGKYDLVLAGNEPNSQGSPDNTLATEFPTTIYKNLGNNTYGDTNKLTVPGDPNFGIVLDFIYRNSNLYVLRSIATPGANYYNGTEVQKVSYPSMASTMLYTHTGPYAPGLNWVRWIYNYNATIVSDDAQTPLSITP